VTVDDNLATRIGAVAIDDEVWISNPVTGDFETLPTGYDIDPSRFFDPEGGWRPLLAALTDVEIVGHRRSWWRALPRPRHRSCGDQVSRHHRRPRPRPGRRGRRLDPSGTSLVTAAEFDTTIDGERPSGRSSSPLRRHVHHRTAEQRATATPTDTNAGRRDDPITTSPATASAPRRPRV
jgi:hypothetical protein